MAVDRENTTVTQDDIEELERQLERMPRGVEKIPARCVCGKPLTVMTSPRLPDGSPFPTVFYLTHPVAVKGCSTLEAEKVMEELNALLQTDSELAEKYAQAHRNYIDKRNELGVVEELDNISAGGMPTRVKCLHALLGHTLSVGEGVNPIGDMVLAMLAERNLWSVDKCYCN